MAILARELRRRDRSGANGIPGYLRAGIIQPVSPTTDTGWRRYGNGREFLPAATNLTTDPQGVLADGTYWPADTANTDTTANQALPVQLPAVPEISKCLKLVNNGTADAPVTANITVVASTSYNQSIYVYAPTLGGNLTITSENGHTFTVAALTAANTGWVRYAVAANTVAGEVVHGLKFTFAGGTASTVYVTGAKLVAETVLTPYFDGSSADCVWTGTANASTSTRGASVLVYPTTTTTTPNTGFTVGSVFVPLYAGAAGSGSTNYLFGLRNAANSQRSADAYWHNGNKKITWELYDGVNNPSMETLAATWAAGSLNNFIARCSATKINLSTNGVTVAEANNTATLATGLTFSFGHRPVNNDLQHPSNHGPCFVAPGDIGATNAALLSTMLTANASAVDLIKFFRDRAYLSTLVIPLASDSTAYRIVA